MTRPITITFSAAADGRAVTCDRDSVIAGFVSTGSTAMLSWDGAQKISGVFTTPADGQLNSIIALASAGTGGPSFIGGLKIPVSSGEVIYASRAAAGSVLIYFDDPE